MPGKLVVMTILGVVVILWLLSWFPVPNPIVPVPPILSPPTPAVNLVPEGAFVERRGIILDPPSRVAVGGVVITVTLAVVVVVVVVVKALVSSGVSRENGRKTTLAGARPLVTVVVVAVEVV